MEDGGRRTEESEERSPPNWVPTDVSTLAGMRETPIDDGAHECVGEKAPQVPQPYGHWGYV